jgi:hypothetical protein
VQIGSLIVDDERDPWIATHIGHPATISVSVDRQMVVADHVAWLLDHLDAILDVVERPDHRTDDPLPGRERFYAHADTVGPSHDDAAVELAHPMVLVLNTSWRASVEAHALRGRVAVRAWSSPRAENPEAGGGDGQQVPTVAGNAEASRALMVSANPRNRDWHCTSRRNRVRFVGIAYGFRGRNGRPA